MSGEREQIRARKDAFESNLVRQGTCSPAKAREIAVREAQNFDRKVRRGEISIDHGRQK